MKIRLVVCVILKIFRMSLTYEIRPVHAAEWLPDRCMSMMDPLAISHLTPQCGCPGLLSGKSPIRNRTDFEDFYSYVLNRFSCCGFVAWEKNRIIGYTNFFPHAIAREIKFYGWGGEEEVQPGTLVHHCISIIRNPDYRRKGIGSGLIRHSLEWARMHGWKRYEVHCVLPDTDQGAPSEQKSILSFWRKSGFTITREEEADEETRKCYGAVKRYSLALDLGLLSQSFNSSEF